MRHAEAARVDPALGDRERPLSRHGRSSAAAVGAHINATGLIPDLVLYSDSRRTRETLEQVAVCFDAESAVRSDPELYLADPIAILQRIRECGGNAERLLVIGHNPGMARLALDLSVANQSPVAPTRISGFPPAALAVFETDTPRWRAFQPAQARLRDIVTPDDLGS